MNTKILASIAVFAMMASIVGTSFTHSVYAADYSMNKTSDEKKSTMDSKMADKKAAMDKKMDTKMTKIDSKMADKKAMMDKKMDDKKAKMDSKMADKKSDKMAKVDKRLDDRKAALDKKMTDKKTKIDSKMADKKAMMDKKMDDKKAKMDSKMADKKSNSTTTSAPVAPAPAASTNSKDVSVEIPKGSATNQKCADQCFVPMKVSVSAGGKVTWKNDDSAAHTATAADGKTFDTSLINAGSSASATFSTAGTFDYMCIVHPWMKGTVSVS